MTETVTSTGSPQQKNTPWRWLLFLAALVGITVLLLDTPVTLRGIILAALGLPVLALIGWGVRQRQPGAWVQRIPGLQAYADTLSQWAVRVALVCMILAAIQLRPTTEPHHVLWLLPGVLLLVLATELRAATEGMPSLPMPKTSSQGRIRWGWLVVGAIALISLTATNTHALPRRFVPLDAYAQGALLLIGILSMSLTFPRQSGATKQRTPIQGHWVALIAILLLAAVLRLWNLEWWTTRWLDEVIYASGTVNLRTPQSVLILTQFNSVTAFSWVYPLLQTPLVAILGPGLLPLRLLSAFVGLLTVAATYRLGCTLFDRRIGLLAALILATLPVHLHFSRIGIANIADPLFGVLMLWFMARATRWGHKSDYAFSGIMLGLTQYFYEGGRIFFPVLAIGWLLMMAFFARRDARYRPPTREHLVAFLGCTVMLAAPLYITWMHWHLPFVPRYDAMQAAKANEMAASLTERWLMRLPTVMRALVHTPDTSWFYRGEQPILLLPLVPFFLLGIGHSLARLTRPAGLLLIWIGGTIASIAFIIDAGSYPRYLVALPGIALAVSLGIISTWDFLRRKRPVPAWVWGLVSIGIIVLQVGYYFGVHIPNFYEYQVGRKTAEGIVYNYDVDNALWRAMGLRSGTYVSIVTQEPPFDFDADVMRRYFGRNDLQVKGVYPIRLEIHLLNIPKDHRLAFFVEPDNELTMQILKYYFDLEYQPYDNPFGLPEAALLDLYLVVDD